MRHSTLDISDYQYLTAFRELLPRETLMRAVASRRLPTRNRVLPLWLLLGLLISWFWLPGDKLPFLLRWFRPGRTTVPSDPAVYRARGRLGWKPFRWLRKHVLRPLADLARDPTAFHHGRRLLAVDGTTLTVADTPANARTFGRPNNQHGVGGYPLIRVVAVCELGTHALVDWVARGYRKSEGELAHRLLRRVPAGALLLGDRNFHSFELWAAAVRCALELLIRVQKGPKFPVQKVLADGSYLSSVRPRRGPNKGARAIPVRVIVYRWTDAAGRAHESRLLTRLLDPIAEPAQPLVELYHRRWEQELVFGEVKAQLRCRVTHLRAHDPVRVMAELDGLLLGHWVSRAVIVRAARQAGIGPVEVSFVGALRVLKARLLGIPSDPNRGPQWWSQVMREIGRERLRPRRARQYPRVRKCTRSHWPIKKSHHQQGTIPTLRVIPTTGP